MVATLLGPCHLAVIYAQPGTQARVTEHLTGRVRLLVLGPLDVRSPDGRELRAPIAQSKRLALLSYLALAGRDRFRRRDTIVGLFWPEADQRAARASLRQALSWLRHELGGGVFSHRGEEEIGVAREHVWCDAVAFDETIADEAPEQALTLFRGDLLEGVFVAGAAPELERWLDAERVRRRQQATRAASTLAQRDAGFGRLDSAVAWARRAVSLSPNDESNHRLLIQLLAAAGDRAGALEAYSGLRERLVADYGAEPSAETARLVFEMRTHRPSERRSHSTASNGSSPPSRPPGSVARSSTSNPDAYLLLVKAEYYLAKRTTEAFARAQGLVREALELDPLYADAYAVLANTYQGFAWYGRMPADEALATAETAAKKAVALDSASAFGHAMLGATLSFYHYRWVDGEEEFRRAIALDPDDGSIRNWYALHLRTLGMVPEALTEIRRAHELDQLYRHYYWAIGYTLTLARRDDDAIVELGRALRLDPSYWRAREELAAALARRSRYDAALHELGVGFEIAGDTEKAQVVAAARGESGYRDAQRRLGEIEHERLRVRAREGEYVPAFDQALVFLDLGDHEAAVAQLERAYAVRDPRLTFVRFGPKYRAIAKHPGVLSLMRAMNLP